MLGLLSGCIDTMDLPVLPEDEGYIVIGQGEEKYIQVMPEWNEEYLGFSEFQDMFCASDGRFYLADSGSGNIHVIRANGQKEGVDYSVLQAPIIIDGKTINPLAVMVDSRYIVYFTDGSNKVYAWHQFLAHTDIMAVVDSIQITNEQGNQMISPYEINFLDGQEYSLDIYTNQLDSSETAINTIREPYVFYNPDSGINAEINPTYASMQKTFKSLAPAESGALNIYANDHRNDYVVKINFMIKNLVKLRSGQYIFMYEGVFGGFAASKGTGSGTVSDITGMTSDQSGNIFYSQLGDYFSVHKLKAGTFGSKYTLGVNEILELDQFEAVMDIAIDHSGNVFVLDSTLNEVKKFNAAGDYIKSLAITETYIKENDSLILYTYNDILKIPTVLAIFEDIIYIGDTGNNRILRYTLADDINIEGPVN